MPLQFNIFDEIAEIFRISFELIFILDFFFALR